MASNNINGSYGTSWADQWDYNPDLFPVSNKSGTAGDEKAIRYTDKMKDGVHKVKAGASVGVRWIKDKYHNTSRKHF